MIKVSEKILENGKTQTVWKMTEEEKAKAKARSEKAKAEREAQKARRAK